MKIAMPREESEKLKSLIDNSNIIMEYGSGGSTIYAGNSGNKIVVTTENDKEFLDSVIEEFPSEKSTLIANYVFTGKTKMWGYPVNDDHKHLWPDYVKQNWSYFFENDINPDLIIIDGRFRIACFLYSLRYANSNTKIFWDDYVNRESYHVVEKIIKPTEIVGRSAIFVKNKEKINHSLIEKYYSDIR